MSGFPDLQPGGTQFLRSLAPLRGFEINWLRTRTQQPFGTVGLGCGTAQTAGFILDWHWALPLYRSSRRCRCRTVSEPGQKASERSEVIERRSVSGEADWGGQNQHSGSAEGPKRAALPPQRGQGDLWLTRGGRRARLSGQGEAQNGNFGLYFVVRLI